MPWQFQASVDLGGSGLAAGTSWALCRREGAILVPHPTLRDIAGSFAEGNGLYAFDTGAVLPDDLQASGSNRISIYSGTIGGAVTNLTQVELGQFTLTAADEVAAKSDGAAGLNAVVAPQPSAEQCTGQLVTYDINGNVKPFAAVQYSLVSSSQGAPGGAFAGETITQTSDPSGSLNILLMQSSVYSFVIDGGTPVNVTTPSSAENFSINQLLGRPTG